MGIKEEVTDEMIKADQLRVMEEWWKQEQEEEAERLEAMRRIYMRELTEMHRREEQERAIRNNPGYAHYKDQYIENI